VKTGVLLALKVLFDPRSTPSSGALENIDIVLPPGSIINPNPPASGMYYYAMVQSIMTAVVNAIDPAMKQDAVAAGSASTSVHHAFGRTLAGEGWGDSCVSAGINSSYAWGASRAGDADSASLPFWMNYALSGTEIAEQTAGAVFLRREVAIDTAGPGYNRGGAGQVCDTYWRHPGLHREYLAQVKAPAHGANGGDHGAPGAVWLFDPETTGMSASDWPPEELGGDIYRKATPIAGVVDPETHLPSYSGDHIQLGEPVFATGGTTVRRVANGGGGWGPAHHREPERVLRDVRDGYVSIEAAARDYAVAIVGDPDKDPEGLAVDLIRTTALRATYSAQAASA
jgi:N-methylhydantoinase B